MDVLDIANPFPLARAYLVRSVGSTQEEAKRLASRWESEGGEPAFPPGSLVAAEEQSAGRGRLPGRRWSSAPGESLLFTIRLPPEAVSLSALPLRIGAAVCRAAAALADSTGASYPRPPRLKWPNDLMLGDAKACGILCESSGLGVFAGIGVNCGQRSFPEDLRGKATSLALELGREVDRMALLERILAELRLCLEDGSWRESVEGLLWRIGEEVDFLPGAAPEPGREPEPLRARLRGIDERGALVLELPGGATEAHIAGELRARLERRFTS